jgi:hypothetical protein
MRFFTESSFASSHEIKFLPMLQRQFNMVSILISWKEIHTKWNGWSFPVGVPVFELIQGYSFQL